MNKIAIISNTEPVICKKFIELGYKLIYTEEVDGFISYEKTHADMQCIKINNEIILLSCCKNLRHILKETYSINTAYTSRSFSGKYPENILLNVQIIGKYVIGKEDHLDKTLLDRIRKYNFKIINVNQGYAGCSCLKVNDKALITADPSIYNALMNTEIDVLKIAEGYIRLSTAGENTFGFIGGASANLDNNTILFFGDIREHPDYSRITDFCNQHNTSIEYIKDYPITDIGSATLLII